MGGGKHPLAFLGKKTWHTKNLKNVEKVWIAEEKEKNEERKLAELQKQLVEERQLLELQEIQAAAGIRNAKSEKLDWMYEGPMSTAVDEKEAEEYLLGKAYEPKDTKAAVNEQISRQSETFMVKSVGPPSKNDAFARLHEDPMMKIRAQELKAREAVVKNPLKMNKVKKVLEAQLRADQDARREQKRDKKEAKRAMKREKKMAKEAKRKRKKERPQDSPPSSSDDERHPHQDQGRHSGRDDRVAPPRSDLTGSTRYGLQGRTVNSYAPEELGPSAAERAKFKATHEQQKPEDPRNRPRGQKEELSEEERARRIREMQSDASEHERTRTERIQKERTLALAESAASVAALQGGGSHGDPKFIKQMEKSVYGGSIDMEERVKRNRQNHQKELGSDSFMRR